VKLSGGGCSSIYKKHVVGVDRCVTWTHLLSSSRIEITALVVLTEASVAFSVSARDSDGSTIWSLVIRSWTDLVLLTSLEVNVTAVVSNE
jgi:hypothetical protein